MGISNFDNAFYQTFDDNIKERYAQKSVLLPHFNVGVAEGEIYWARLIEGGDATLKGAKGTDTGDNGVDTFKRQVVTQAWKWSSNFNETEVVKMGNSPASKLVQIGGDKIGVAIDLELIRAIGGTAVEGASTPVPLPPTQVVGDGTTGFNLDMLLEGHEKLDLANVPTGPESRLFIYPGQVLRQALKIEEIASSLYNDKKVLNDREVGTFTDCAWLNVQSLIKPDASGVVRAYLVDKNAIEAAFWSELKTRIAENPAKQFDTIVYLERYFGATRLQEKGVVAFDIKVA